MYGPGGLKPGDLIVIKDKTTYLKHKNKSLYKTSLSSLMQLYAKNYRDLNRLFDINNLQNNLKIKFKSDAVAIHIYEVSNYRYTTTLRMSYIFKNKTGTEKIPNAKLKIYKDTHQVEVLAINNFNEVTSFVKLTRLENLSNVDARWQLNTFLSRWLEYCLTNYKKRK